MFRLSLQDGFAWSTALLATSAVGISLGLTAWTDLKGERREMARGIGALADVGVVQLEEMARTGLEPEAFEGCLERWLESFESDGRVSAAVLHGDIGVPLIWVRDEGSIPEGIEAIGVGQHLVDGHVIAARSCRLGTAAQLTIWADLSELDRRRAEWWMIGLRGAALTGVISFLIASLIARRPGRYLSTLAQVDALRGRRSGSKRLPEQGNSELTRIAHGVNHLLDEMADRDQVIARMRQESERSLTERTAELTALNQELVQSQRAAQAAAQAKTDFLANMSHEVRTPLNAVMGMTELLSRTELDPEQRSLTDKVRSNADGLLAILGDIIDFSKLEAGRLEIESEAFDVRALVHDVVALSTKEAQDKGIELAFFVDFEVPARVYGDHSRVRQILMKFLSNAVKFTEEGEVVVLVQVETDAACSLRFTVRDTGIGIPENRQAHLFEEFHQVDTSTTRRFGGTGLGLALSRRLARLMGGEVDFASREGEGSTFWSTLPLAHAEAEAGREDLVVPPELIGRRVMVIKERSGAADILGWQLTAVGLELSTERSIYDAFETLMRDPDFDAVLLDVRLPGRDAFLAAIANQEVFSRIRVVLMTPLLASRELSTEEGPVVARLSQPARLPDLVASVCQAMSLDAPDSAAQESEPKDLLDTSLRERVRILVVDDNSTNQQLLQYLLGKRGYRVDVAGNGRKAVDAVTVGDYDVILMDCQMPELDGFEATRMIREMEAPRGEHVPILAMTANALSGDRERCLEAGMDDHIAKPIQPAGFIQWMEGWLLRSIAGGRVPQAPKAPETVVDPRSIDREVLACLLDDDDAAGKELAQELIDHYLSNAPEIFLGLMQSYEKEDWENAASIAHGLVSSCGTVGAVRFATLLRRVETTIHSGDRREAGALLEDAQRELDQSIAALKEIVTV